MARFLGSGRRFTCRNVAVDGWIKAESDNCKFNVVFDLDCAWKCILKKFLILADKGP